MKKTAPRSWVGKMESETSKKPVVLMQFVFRGSCFWMYQIQVGRKWDVYK